MNKQNMKYKYDRNIEKGRE